MGGEGGDGDTEGEGGEEEAEEEEEEEEEEEGGTFTPNTPISFHFAALTPKLLPFSPTIPTNPPRQKRGPSTSSAATTAPSTLMLPGALARSRASWRVTGEGSHRELMTLLPPGSPVPWAVDMGEAARAAGPAARSRTRWGMAEGGS